MAMLAIVSHQTAPMESQIPPIPIANPDAGYQELLQSAAGVPAFAIAAILVLTTTATSTRVLIIGMLLTLQLYISFYHGAPILEKIGLIMEKMSLLVGKFGLIMEKMSLLVEKFGLIMEKIPPLVEKIGPILTTLCQALGSVTAALTFPVTITVLVVRKPSSTKFIIFGMFLAVYYNGNVFINHPFSMSIANVSEASSTLEILKALPEVLEAFLEVLKAFLEALKPLIEVPVQRNAILQLLVFLPVMAFIRHHFNGGMPVFGIL